MLLVLFVLGLWGCAGYQPVRQEASRAPIVIPLQGVQDAPTWVTQKKVAFSDDRRFYGVGNASGVQSPVLRRRAAEAQAIRDIAQTMQTFIGALQQQYLADTTTGDLNKRSAEQHITDTMTQVTRQVLNGVRIAEYWENPSRDEAYALAVIDLGKVAAVMRTYQAQSPNMNALGAQALDYVIQHVTQAHAELSQSPQQSK